MQGKFGVGVPNFLSRRNPQFKDLNGATDRYYRDLRAKGIGVEKKRAQPLSEEDIETLWSSKVIGVDSPQALLNAVFLLKGKNFALRNSEHYSLKVSQLTRVHDPDGYIYNKNGSKNRSGGTTRLPNSQLACANICMPRVQGALPCVYFGFLFKQASGWGVFE